jgi:CubicO group peptidase (beta-lactamase class C family)
MCRSNQVLLRRSRRPNPSRSEALPDGLRCCPPDHMKTPALLIALSLSLQGTFGPGLRAVAPPAAGDAAVPTPFKWLRLSPIPIVDRQGAAQPDESTQRKAFAADLLAAQGGEAQVRPHLGEKMSVNGAEREWQVVHPVDDMISLNSAGKKDDFEVAYAATEFDVPAATQAWLGIGSDDGIRVWLNGTLVHEKWSARSVQLDEDVVSVPLKAGRNRLLLKVQNITGSWGFACRLMDADLRAGRMVSAAKNGEVSALKELIDRGLDINGRTSDGLTPWLAARIWGQKAAADFLAQKGADTQSASPAPETLVDGIFKEWNTLATPGAAVAVVEKGRLILEKGYGIANLEYGVPIKPETVFHVASVSKQFTAMAVVLLESAGKLSLDDDVHKYLPELPEYGFRISIRNLLQHTSGIRDQWQTLALAGWSLEDVITQDQILRLMFRQKALNFPPGTRFAYSNAGFTLLAEIVARVSGKPFPQFCSERIFVPLGMAHTHFHQDLTQVVPGRAYSYHQEGSGYAASPLNYANVGATSLFTTAGDLAKWLDNFRDLKVGGAAGIARLQEPCVLSDGTKPDYGLGVALGSHRGLRTISHGGADAGYRSAVIWFPDQEFGVAVVSNLGSFNPDQAAKAVAAVYLHEKMKPAEVKPESVERTFIAMEPKELEQYAGIYPLPKIGQTFQMVMENGKLWAAGQIQPPWELRPVGPARFYLRELQAEIEFSPKAGGGMVVKITQPGAVNEGERSAMTALPIEADLHPYAGVYWSDELETQYTIFVRDGKLFGLHAHHGEFALTPTMRDQFSTGLWFASEVKFLRNAAGQITGATLGGGRVSGVQFTLKPGDILAPAAPASASVKNGSG